MAEASGTELAPTHADHRERTAMAVRPTAGTEVLMPLNAAAVVDGMKAYQQLLADLLEPSDWQETDQRNPDGSKKKFPKKSAWRKIGRAFNISFEIVARDVTYDAKGSPIRAETLARAVAPNGQYGDGDGYCAISEFKGKRANDPKIENTMRATATTRAKNRAIADLVGMGEVSAEELAAGGGEDAPAATLGPPASEKLEASTSRALALLLDMGEGPDDALAEAALAAIVKDCGDYLPRSVARAFALAGKTLNDAITKRDAPEPTDAEPKPPPAQQPAQEYGQPPVAKADDQAAGDAPQPASQPSEPPAVPSPQAPANLCMQAYKGSKTVVCVKPADHQGPHEASGGSGWMGDGSDLTASRDTAERAERASGEAKRADEQAAAAAAEQALEEGAAETVAGVTGELLPPEEPEPSEAELAEAREAAGQESLGVDTDDIDF